MGKVTREIAVAEFEKWTSYKRLPKNKLEDEVTKRCAEEMIAEIEEGTLSLNEAFEWEYDLKFPIDNTNITKLVFKPRISQGVLDARYKKIEAKDFGGRLIATISALTGENEGTIRCLDTSDSSLCNAIVSYFF